MHRAEQHTQQRIADLVDACAGYWELRGIAREHITEMQLELEQHLQQAVSDGKSLEAVLGPNPAAFAEAWAREMHPHFWRGGAVVLHGLVYALSVVSTSALLSQLLAHAPAFTFTLFAAYLLTGSGLLALLLQLRPDTPHRDIVRELPFSPHQHSSWARGTDAHRCRAGGAGPAPGWVDGELEHGTSLLELAHDHRLACPGGFPVLPGLLA